MWLLDEALRLRRLALDLGRKYVFGTWAAYARLIAKYEPGPASPSPRLLVVSQPPSPDPQSPKACLV